MEIHSHSTFRSLVGELEKTEEASPTRNDMTSFDHQEKIYNRKLAQVYVALTMTRDVAERFKSSNPEPEATHSLLTLLSVASDLLEEILDEALPEPEPTESEPEISELLM